MASPVAAGVLFLGRRIPLKHFRSYSVPPSKTKVVDIILESKPNYEDVKLRPPKPNTAKISELSSMQQQQAHQIAIIIITTTKIKKKNVQLLLLLLIIINIPWLKELIVTYFWDIPV